MSARRKNPQPILMTEVSLVWYLPVLLAILALGYAAVAGWLPSWLFMLVLFALFMWVFSLGFALYAVLMRFVKERKEPRP
ncbi:MAG: hypothetical protein ACOH2L_02155 [Devosia sp.]